MQYDVLWLNISMDDIEQVDFFDGIADLSHDHDDFGLGQGLLFLEFLIELSSGTDFQDEIDSFLVFEESEHLYDVRMVQIHLDF